MLRACVIEFTDSWDEHLPLIEFAYNNSYHSSIKMAPYEALYGRKCQSPLYWSEVGERRLFGPNRVQEINEQLKLIQKKILTAQSRQKSYTSKRRRPLEFEVDSKLFLTIYPMKCVILF